MYKQKSFIYKHKITSIIQCYKIRRQLTKVFLCPTFVITDFCNQLLFDRYRARNYDTLGNSVVPSRNHSVHQLAIQDPFQRKSDIQSDNGEPKVQDYRHGI